MSWNAFGRSLRRTVPLAVPLILVNLAAVYGQAGWFYENVIHNWAVAYGLAATIESIGVFLAYEAHTALMAGDASIRLRATSYAIGALVGALNYAHWSSAGYRPNPVALTFGLLSSISPWLWAIRSRSLNRDRLRELGLIDPRAVRFAVIRWVMFPGRTAKAFRAAVWAGVVQPAEAIANADAARGVVRAASKPVKPQTAASEDVAKPAVVRKAAPKSSKVAQVLAVRPDLSTDEAAKLAGVSKRTARRVVNGHAVPELVEVAG